MHLAGVTARAGGHQAHSRCPGSQRWFSASRALSPASANLCRSRRPRADFLVLRVRPRDAPGRLRTCCPRAHAVDFATPTARGGPCFCRVGADESQAGRSGFGLRGVEAHVGLCFVVSCVTHPLALGAASASPLLPPLSPAGCSPNTPSSGLASWPLHGFSAARNSLSQIRSPTCPKSPNVAFSESPSHALALFILYGSALCYL